MAPDKCRYPGNKPIKIFVFVFHAGEYSCLSVDLIFKRQFSYYLITIYVPGCMLVIVSWVSTYLCKLEKGLVIIIGYYAWN